MSKITDIKILDISGFKVLYVSSSPPRIEAKVTFDMEHMSQKLVFTLMDITHTHGFGCSMPIFNDDEDSSMSFLIGTIMPSSKSLNKYSNRIKDCLDEVSSFAEDFQKQLDFTTLDLTMFHDYDTSDLFPEHLAVVRDQYHGGSWESYQQTVLENGKIEEADYIGRCMLFEELNDKDLALVGHKLGDILDLLDSYDDNREFN